MPVAYEVKESKVHGRGVFATRNIQKGERIFDEQPFLKGEFNRSDITFVEQVEKYRRYLQYAIIPLIFLYCFYILRTNVTVSQKVLAISVVFIILSAVCGLLLLLGKNIEIEELSKKIREVSSDEAHPVNDLHTDGIRTPMAVMVANCFDCEFGPIDENPSSPSRGTQGNGDNEELTKPSCGLFCVLSKLNHSCSPNASFHFRASTGKAYVHAVDNIKAGSEIFIEYCPPLLEYAERQKTVASWGFKCSCSKCSMPFEDRSLSDKRRLRIFELDQVRVMLSEQEPPTLDDKTEDLKVKKEHCQKVIEKFDETLSIMDLEGPMDLMVDSLICNTAFQECMLVGDLETAKRFAQRAYEGALLSRGGDYELTERLDKYRTNPELSFIDMLIQVQEVKRKKEGEVAAQKMAKDVSEMISKLVGEARTSKNHAARRTDVLPVSEHLPHEEDEELFEDYNDEKVQVRSNKYKVDTPVSTTRRRR